MFTLDYLKLPHLCFDKKLTIFKNMTIILVEIVRMVLGAFWSEKLTICKHNISPHHFPVICQAKKAYLDVEKNCKNKSSRWIWLIFMLFGS